MAKREDLELARSYVKECIRVVDAGSFGDQYTQSMFKDMDRAKKLIDDFLKEYPDDTEARAELARWHLCKARDEGRLKYGEGKAMSHMQEVVRLIPDSANYRLALGLLYAKTGKKAQAVEQLQKAVELEPGDIKFRKELDRLTAEKSGCFIATAAYGAHSGAELRVFYEFRDRVLIRRNWGAWFVTQYYRFSPRVARVIEGREVLRCLVRVLLLEPLRFLAKLLLRSC
jgi:tetratricopeptide (TPR) repeat protein